MEKSPELADLLERTSKALDLGETSIELFQEVATNFVWLGVYKFRMFSFLFSTLINPKCDRNERIAAGEALCLISSSKSFSFDPIILPSVLTVVLKLFESVDTVIGQYALDILSYQIIFSQEIHILFFSAGLFSNYFVTLAESVDLTKLVLALTKYSLPENEEEAIYSWCQSALKDEVLTKDKCKVVLALSNVKRIDNLNQQLAPTSDEILGFIYENCKSDSEAMREACFAFIFWSECPIEPVLETIFEAVTNSISENGMRIIVKYEEDLCSSLREEMAKLLFSVAQNYPFLFQKVAVGIMFKYSMHTMFDNIEIFKLLVHFINDEEIVQDVAPALFNYILYSSEDDALKMVEVLDDYKDEIQQLVSSSNQIVSECGNFLEALTDPIPQN